MSKLLNNSFWIHSNSLLTHALASLSAKRSRFAGKFITSDEAPLIDMAYHPRSGSVAFGSIAIATSKKVKLVNLNSGTSTFEVCEWAVDEVRRSERRAGGERSESRNGFAVYEPYSP